MTADRIRVALADRAYDVLVAPGLIGEAGRHLAPLLKEPRAFVVTDERVAQLHLPALGHSLDQAAIRWSPIALPPGETTKDFANLERVIDRLLADRIERGHMLVALGGGVIGDLAGFAAAVVLRGVDYVQVPTTLLAQVDSSVGGKTAINTRRGKNLVGSFHQPRLVLADIDVLQTLSKREFLAGYAEVVKYGLIGDADFFSWLEGHGAAIVDGDPEARRRAVAQSCAAKAAIVAADERENGVRMLLNLGHTFGHALEAECGFSDEMLHGEAVAMGLVLAFELSHRLGLCSAEDAGRVRRHLAAVGLPTSFEAYPERAWDPDALIEHMRGDKKVAGGRVAFVLAHRIGEAFVARDVDLAEVRALLADEMAD